MKIASTICFVLLTFLTFGQEKKKRKIIPSQFTAFGIELSQPQLRYDMKPDGLWQGAFVDVLGAFSIGYTAGHTKYADSTGYVVGRGTSWYFGYQGVKPLFNKMIGDVYLTYGVGFEKNEAQHALQQFGKVNGFYDDRDGDPSALGLYANVGVGAHLGPFLIRAKVRGFVGINGGGNGFNWANWYPSVGIGYKVGQLLLNPSKFTSQGLRYRTDNYLTDVKQRYNAAKMEVYNELEITSKTTFREGDIQIYDTRPYFFVGPIYQGSLDYGRERGTYSTVGLQTGFRAGGFYFEGFYEAGDMYFKDIDRRKLTYQSPDYLSPRMDGAFTNTTRYGAKVGLELISFFKKSNYIPLDGTSADDILMATSFYGIIPTFGIGRISLGNYEFVDEQAMTLYQQQLANGAMDKYEANRLGGDVQRYFSFGLNLSIGCASLEYNIYRIWDLPTGVGVKMSSIGVAYKLPLFRFIRMIRSKSSFAHAEREFERQL